MKLCLGLIARNEEKMLSLLLPNLSKAFEQEIIAIDYGSTDKTEDILRKYCKTTIKMERPDNFGEAKTNLIEFAEEAGYDWIYVIDADETFDTRWVDIIKKTVQENEFDLYYNPRLNYLDVNTVDASVSSYPDLQARLFKLNVGYHYRNPRHCILYKNNDEQSCWELQYGAVLPMYLIHLKGLRGKEENIKSIFEREINPNFKIEDVVMVSCKSPLKLEVGVVK